MTQVVPAPDSKVDGPPSAAQEQRPGRLRLRRRLLLWSSPALLLLLLLAVKLASVGILGNRLPAQFSTHDQAGMESALQWLDVGSVGRGYRERLAAGDLLALGLDLNGARSEFEAALADEPAACSPRGNFALVSETLSDNELREGHFIDARNLLEPAAQASDADKACFATSVVPIAEVRDFVGQTPERLALKLAALKGGLITETPDGYDYLRTPGGTILAAPVSGGMQICPLEDDARMRGCIEVRDAERAAKIAEAQRQAEAQQPPPAPDQPPAPGAPPVPPPPVAPPAPPAPVPGSPAPGGQAPGEPEFPGPIVISDDPRIAFCTPDGKPLGDLAAALCTTSGPLP